MTPRLNTVVTALDLPETELWAARLDGGVTALAEAFLPAGTPLSSAVRARSLAPILPARAILELQSVAWVHGATERLPARHRIAVHAADRSPAPRHSRLLVREVIFRPCDVESIEGVWLTSAARTAIDLARQTSFTPADDAPVLQRLLATACLDLLDCQNLLNRSRNLPNKREALKRITAALLLGPAAVGTQF